MRRLMWLVAVLALVGCGTTKKQQTKSKARSNSGWGRSHNFNDAGANTVKHDLNHDGRIDVTKVSRAGTLVREEWDLNQDGKTEIWRYYDENGQIEGEEVDADYDGKLDVISHYQGGVLTMREESHNFIGQATTKKHYEKGVLQLVEQDTDDDGKFDTWEFYQKGQLVKIGRDTNGDGREDQFTKPTEKLVGLATTKAPAAGSSGGGGAAPPEGSDKAEPTEPAEGAGEGGTKNTGTEQGDTP
jgi:hypothetical protein